MANYPNHRYGETNPVTVVTGDNPISIGDLILVASGIAGSASIMAHGASEAADQESFHYFLGVSAQAKLATGGGVTHNEPIRLDATGVHEFNASGTINQFDLVGAKLTGSALENQTVKTVATPNLAIGRAVKAAANGKVLVQVKSVLLLDGHHAPA